MMKRTFALLLSLALPIATVPPAVAKTEATAATRYPAVQAFADALVRDGKVPGIAIAIGEGDGAPRWITAGKTGLAARDPAVTPDTLWRIYSMTKPITGVAAMILVDEGKLRLDQPLADFFPEFAHSRVLTDPLKGMETRRATGEITIRELLTHTAGLDYAILTNTPAKKELERQGMVPAQVNAAYEARLRPLRPATLAAFAQRAAAAPLVADPGTTWSYSMGLDVLGAVIERASGMPFDAFVQRRILDPLGMRSTFWQVPAAQGGRLATDYGVKGLADRAWPGVMSPATDQLVLVDPAASSVFLEKPALPFGGAGLVSTARDYDRFLHMLLNDGRLGRVRILSAATARLAKSDLLPNGLAMSGFGPVPPGETVGFGAGGFVTLRDVDGFGRGKGTYGWDGAAGSRAWVDPVRRVRAVMMINVLGQGAVGADFDKAIARDLKK